MKGDIAKLTNLSKDSDLENDRPTNRSSGHAAELIAA
jgi:hypothetical protein